MQGSKPQNLVVDKMRLYIFGAGDNVSNRLLPAILRANITNEITVIHAGLDLIPRSAQFAKIERILIDPGASNYASKINSLIREEECFIFISVPPAAQLDLLRVLKNTKCRIVLEKPLYTSSRERDEFLRISEDISFFCFSYYALEKALTWSHFFCPDKRYEQFMQLNFPGDFSIDAARDSLGRLRHVEIMIKEGVPHVDKNRSTLWFETIPHGIWFDMGVHAFSLLGKTTKLGDVKPVSVAVRNLAEARAVFERQIRFNGVASDVTI